MKPRRRINLHANAGPRFAPRTGGRSALPRFALQPRRQMPRHRFCPFRPSRWLRSEVRPWLASIRIDWRRGSVDGVSEAEQVRTHAKSASLLAHRVRLPPKKSPCLGESKLAAGDDD